MNTIVYAKKENDNEMRTYYIEYDEEVLDTFRVNAIYELSKVVHYDYESATGPYNRKLSPDPMEIQDYQKTFMRKENNIPIYRHEYDHYEFPYIVTLIDKLQKGNAKAIAEILNPDFSKERIPILEEIKNKKEQLVALKDTDLEKQKELLEEIKELLLKYQSGDYEVPAAKYYEQLKDLLVIEEEKTDVSPKEKSI